MQRKAFMLIYLNCYIDLTKLIRENFIDMIYLAISIYIQNELVYVQKLI